MLGTICVALPIEGRRAACAAEEPGVFRAGLKPRGGVSLSPVLLSALEEGSRGSAE